MPWKETDAVKERVKFVLEWELFEKTRGMVNVSELCRADGISRPTGYTWLNRYRGAGPGRARPREPLDRLIPELRARVTGSRTRGRTRRR